MGYSSLVSYVRWSPNNSGKRYYNVTRFTPHCVVGQCSVEALGAIFADPNREASSNYGIGVDGRVACYVDEDNRSWCSSSWDNDNRAITVECASDSYAPWAFKEVVYERLIELCVDVCNRYGKDRVIWIDNKDQALSYNLAPNEMLLTVHKWFANKACPGDWMMARMKDFAARVNAALQPPQPEPTPEPTPEPKTPQPPNNGKKKKEDYNITYNSYVPGWPELGWGWLGWMGDGELSGTKGQGMLIEAIKIDAKKGINLEYQIHSQTVGNSDWVKNGETCGPITYGLRAEAFRIKCNKKIKYRAYVQKKGWLPWVTNGEWAGTRGEGLRMEAFQIKLA